MTREAFIKKWLGNRDYNYCEEHKDLMRDDLDSVLEFHKGQVKNCDLADVGGNEVAVCEHPESDMVNISEGVKLCKCGTYSEAN